MNRQSLRRVGVTALLAGGAAAGALATAGEAQAVTPDYYGYGSTVGARVVAPVPLNVRYGPGTDRWIIGTFDNGTYVRVACKADGTNVYGNHRWYKLAYSPGWVSAHYVTKWGHLPWCVG